MDPFQPHYIPSSPQSICSSDGVDTLFGLADSLPLFPDLDALMESVPGDAFMQQPVHPSVQLSIGRTGPDWRAAHVAGYSDPSPVDGLASSLQETGYTDLRSDVDGLVDHVVRQQWWSVAVRELTPEQLVNLRLRKELQYGDDCSGARAPYEALVQLVTKLLQEKVADICICDRFASECPGTEGDGPRQFIQAQNQPDIMFETVHRGADAVASRNLLTGHFATIPANLTIYTAGWVCRDVSPMNCHPKELLPGTHKKVVAGKAGASSQTLNSSLRYIETHRPDIALLENLVFKKNISIAVAALKKMGGYSTIVFLIDSRTFTVPMSRRRMYVLAIRTYKLTAPLQRLGSQLNVIAGQMPSISTGTLAKFLDENAQVDGCQFSTESLPKSRRKKALPTVRHKKVDEVKWKPEHDALRKKLGLPSRKDIVENVIAHSPLAASLPPRCQELLGLHWEVAKRSGIDPSQHHFIWDLTNSAQFGCVKDPRLAGVVPCVLRGHILWDTKMGRPLKGTELLRVHGFCLEPAVSKLDDGILRKLAGDTISVPPIGCILMLALASICPHGNYADSSNPWPVHFNDHHVGPRWIGPSAWRGYDRSIDNLFKVAGLTPMIKKARSSRLKAKSCIASRRINRNLQARISLD